MSLINIEKTITLDVYDHDTTPAVIKTIQMDTGARSVFAMIQNSRQDYDIGQNATVSLTVLRPDKTKVQITGQPFISYTGTDSTMYGAKAELSDVALAVKGNLKAQFKITSGEQELRTEIFTINNGEALDAGDGDWAGDLDGHNLDEMAESIETLQTDMAAVNEDVSDLKEDLNTKVDLNGENQITPQNIEGMQYTKTTEEVEGENIFTSDMLFAEGKYVTVTSSNTVGRGDNNSYNAYCIPVEQNTKYKFTTSRFVVLATGNTLGSPTIGTTQSNLSEIETGEATYLFISINVNSISNIYVKPVTVDAVYSDFILPDWLVDNLPIPTVAEKPKFDTATGNIASGGNLQLTAPRNNLRKGERIVFEGNITSFNSLTIGITYGTNLAESTLKNYFVIDDANISYHANNTSTPVTVAHGLTIVNNIQIVWEMTATASLKFTLISNGNLFEHEFTNFVRTSVGNPFVLSSGTALTDCKLTWTCIDIDKKIWMFGDSYFTYSDARWTYYLHQYGYDQNCLLDGFPGESGVNGRVAFNNLLQFGTPKYAVWCLGMNDTSDSESAPASAWVNARDLFLQYCENNGVTPMFGTIPTVPAINHEQKNAWIRSSGYRYIDFAKAVGSNANGVWYSGMLSGDNVHPTAQGARALFAQVLVDFPEIMLDV